MSAKHLAATLQRLGETQPNMSVPLTMAERADLRAAARVLRVIHDAHVPELLILFSALLTKHGQQAVSLMKAGKVDTVLSIGTVDRAAMALQQGASE